MAKVFTSFSELLARMIAGQTIEADLAGAFFAFRCSRQLVCEAISLGALVEIVAAEFRIHGLDVPDEIYEKVAVYRTVVRGVIQQSEERAVWRVEGVAVRLPFGNVKKMLAAHGHCIPSSDLDERAFLTWMLTDEAAANGLSLEVVYSLGY